MADLKMPKYTDPVTVVARVRDSHVAVVEGIATASEKHRDAMNAKRDKLKQHVALSTELPHAKT